MSADPRFDRDMAAIDLRANARWAAAAQLTRLVVQFGSILVFARLLTRTDYGIVALAGVVANLAYAMRDLGIGPSIIQRPTLDGGLLTGLFALSAASGLVQSVVVWLIAPTVASFFSTPELTAVLRALAPIFFIGSLGSVQQALVERHARLKVVALAEAVAGIGGLLVGVAMAFAHQGPLSLVGQMVTTAVVYVGIMWLCAHWHPGRRIDVAGVRSVLAFGGFLTAASLADYARRNLDTMLIGRLFGPAASGAYNVAYRVVLFPLQNLTYVSTRALLPSMSGAQQHPERLAALFLRSVGLIALLCLPLMAGVWITRIAFAHVVFGAQWTQAGEILAWLAPVGALRSLGAATDGIFLARARGRVMLLVTATAAVLMAAGMLIGGASGLGACLWGLAAAFVAESALSLLLACRELELPARRLLATLAPALAVATGVALAVALAQHAAARAGLGERFGFIASLAGGSVAFVALAPWLARAAWRDLLSMVPARWRRGERAVDAP